MQSPSTTTDALRHTDQVRVPEPTTTSATTTGSTGHLTFVTSVRHPDNSNDYGRVEELLTATLRSLTAQTVEASVVVVANRPLPPAARLPGVQEVIVEFPAPSAVKGAATSRDAVLLDKGSKLAVGTSRVTRGYVMFVDADDFVSSRLAAWVSDHRGPAGWFVERGWSFDATTGLSIPVRRFNTVCGTSLIVRRDLLAVPASTTTPTRQEVVDALGMDVLIRQFGSHRHLAADAGLEELPIPGAVYSVGTGENHSGTRHKELGRPVARAVREEFHLPGPSKAAVWSGFLRQGISRGARRALRAAMGR